MEELSQRSQPMCSVKVLSKGAQSKRSVKVLSQGALPRCSGSFACFPAPSVQHFSATAQSEASTSHNVGAFSDHCVHLLSSSKCITPDIR